MWITEYQDGRTAILQEARISEIEHDSGDTPYVGITYEDGEEKEELLYAGWSHPEEGPYPTLEDAFAAFFQRKGLDVSEIVENREFFEDWDLGELAHTQNAAVICVWNSFHTDYVQDGSFGMRKVVCEGTDWTNLRKHIEKKDEKGEIKQ